MIRAFSFQPDANLTTVDLPSLPDLTAGLGLQLWVLRASPAPEQRLLRLGASDGSEVLLETGTEPDTLILSQVRGAQRWQIAAPGALPDGRFVRLRITIGPDGAAALDVFDLRVAEGSLGPPPTGPRALSLSPATPRSRFLGAVSSVQIYKSPRLGAADLWAAYPLDDAPLLRRDEVRPGVIRQSFRLADTSGNNRHATCAVASIGTFEGALTEVPIPALRLPRAGGGVDLAPIGAFGDGVTVEAWVRPDSADQPRALLHLAYSACTFTLLAGGSSGTLALRLAMNLSVPITRTLFSVDQLLSPGAWAHVAVTLQRDGGALSAVLYVNGRRRGQGSYALASRFSAMALKQALGACTLARLGADGAGQSGFIGALAEVRVTGAPLADAAVGARWLRRLCGDEPGLRACYPLDASQSGYTRDSSPGRSVFVLTGAATIEDVAGLPVPSALAGAGVRLAAAGKLVRETLLIVPRDFVRAGLPLPPGSYASDDQTTRATISLFDATLEPRTDSGQTFADQPLQVRVDQAVTALLVDDQGVARPQRWQPGQIYPQPLPPNGVLRLRFLASGLSCPTVRVRCVAMPGDLWALVWPDATTHDKLRGISGADLSRPADGRPSPLPSGTGDTDADALAAGLTGLARALPPVPQSTRAFGANRGLFDDLKHVYNDGVDAVKAGVDAAGDLADAVADVGQDAVRQATKLPRTAGQLMKWTGSQLDDLIAKARQVPARVGRDAISTYIDNADSLAVVSSAGLGELVHTLEVVGTSLVKGTTTLWRLSISGLGDALTAMEALCRRVGAAVDKILDYLAYLFKWGDFLRAAEEAYKVIETAIGQIPSFLGQLDSFKARISGALSSAVEPQIMDRSLAQLLGINVSPDSPGVAELDYVLEQLQRVMRAVDLVTAGEGAAAAVGAGAAAAWDDTPAAAMMGSLPYDRLTQPVALLTTPLSQLLGNAAGVSSGSGSLVDQVFKALQDGAGAALDQSVSLLKMRLYVPVLTPLLEETILGGKPLNLLRMVALIAGICSVLVDKLTGGRGGSRRSVGATQSLSKRVTARPRTTRSDTTTQPAPAPDPAPASQPRPSSTDIWVPTAFDLVSTLLLGVQTALELYSVGKDGSAEGRKGTEKTQSVLGLAAGGLAGMKGIVWLVYYVKNARAPLRDYYVAASTFEGLTGVYMCYSNIQRLKPITPSKIKDAQAAAQAEHSLNLRDAAFMGMLMVATVTTTAVPVGKGYVKGTQNVVQFSLKATVGLMNMFTRSLSFLDNERPTVKKVTAISVGLSCGADLAEAIYNHVTSTPSS